MESSCTSVMMGRTKLGWGSFINSELIREHLKEFQGKGAFTNVLLLTGNALRTPRQPAEGNSCFHEFFNCLQSCCWLFLCWCSHWWLPEVELVLFFLAIRLVSEHSRVFPAISKLQNMPLTFKVAIIKYLFFSAKPSGNYLNWMV